MTELAQYEGNCPKCGHHLHNKINASMPTVNRCERCGHNWNPDNHNNQCRNAVAQVIKTRPEFLTYCVGYFTYPVFSYQSTLYKAVLTGCEPFTISVEKAKYWMLVGHHGDYTVYQSVPCV
jgi:hypothetical protein